MIISIKAIEAAQRLLDPQHVYRTVVMSGLKDECEAFAKDVALVSEALAQIVALGQGKEPEGGPGPWKV